MFVGDPERAFGFLGIRRYAPWPLWLWALGDVPIEGGGISCKSAMSCAVAASLVSDNPD